MVAWLRAQDEAVALLKNDPEAAAAAIAAELGITPEEALAQTKGLTFLSGAEQISAEWLGTPEAPGKFPDTLLATGEFLVKQGKIPTAPSLETLRAGIATQLLQQAFGS